jgi:hypothetical protein
VEGAPFAEKQAQAWREMLGPLNHFEFHTGWGCLNVLTAGEPIFEVVAAPTVKPSGPG